MKEWTKCYSKIVKKYKNFKLIVILSKQGKPKYTNVYLLIMKELKYDALIKVKELNEFSKNYQ